MEKQKSFHVRLLFFKKKLSSGDAALVIKYSSVDFTCHLESNSDDNKLKHTFFRGDCSFSEQLCHFGRNGGPEGCPRTFFTLKKTVAKPLILLLAYMETLERGPSRAGRPPDVRRFYEEHMPRFPLTFLCSYCSSVNPPPHLFSHSVSCSSLMDTIPLDLNILF